VKQPSLEKRDRPARTTALPVGPFFSVRQGTITGPGNSEIGLMLLRPALQRTRVSRRQCTVVMRQEYFYAVLRQKSGKISRFLEYVCKIKRPLAP
jgi:hypothetical protein